MTNQSTEHSNQEANTRRKWIILAAVSLVPLIAIIGISIYKNKGGTSASNFNDVDWTLFKELDLNTGTATPRLQALDGKRVRAPGFMVPREDNRSGVTEYVWGHNPRACIHAPPPPSDQRVYVRMVQGPAKMIYGPVWVEGTLRVASQTHQYGNAGFQIYGEVTVPYK